MTTETPGLTWVGAGVRACLVESVESFVHNAVDHGHTPPVVAALDIDEHEIDERERALLQQISKRYGVSIAHSTTSVRQQAMGRLEGDFDPDSMEFAILADTSLSDFPGPGANQNAMLLAHAGQRFISTDDDVYAAPGVVGHRSTGDPRAFSYSDTMFPYRIRYFSTRNRLLEELEPLELDIVGQHTGILGAKHTRGEEKPDSTLGSVRITTAGAYGDSGMGSARSILRMEDETRAVHFSTDEEYGALRLSRELARIPERNIVGPSTHLMGAHFGLDNTRLLPPFLPVGRNADGLFGVMTRIVDLSSLTAFLDFGVYHDPPEPRSFLYKSLIELRPTLADLIMALAVFHRPPTELRDPRERLRQLGATLLEIATLPTGDYLQLLHDDWSKSIYTYAETLEDLLSRYDHSPALWAEDVDAHLEIIYERLREPTSLFTARSGQGSVEQARTLTGRYGRLLVIWPDLWEYFAERNRRDEEPLLYREV